jgi:predicted nucleic acid-binding protein
VTEGCRRGRSDLSRRAYPARDLRAAVALDDGDLVLALEVEQVWNVLPMDGPTFRSRARLMHRRSEKRIEDAMIAAMALVHGLTVVTRNVRDFAPLGVEALNLVTPQPGRR